MSNVTFVKKFGGRLKAQAGILSTQVMDDSVGRSVLKVTNPHFEHDKEKHIQRILNAPQDKIEDIINKIRNRVRGYDWKTVLLSLMLYHRMLNQCTLGSARVVAQQRSVIFNMHREMKDLVIKPEDRPHQTTIHAYGQYLEELCVALNVTSTQLDQSGESAALVGERDCVSALEAWSHQWQLLLKIPLLDRHEEFGLTHILRRDGVALYNSCTVAIGQLIIAVTEIDHGDHLAEDARSAVERVRSLSTQFLSPKCAVAPPAPQRATTLKKLDAVFQLLDSVLPQVTTHKLEDVINDKDLASIKKAAAEQAAQAQTRTTIAAPAVSLTSPSSRLTPPPQEPVSGGRTSPSFLASPVSANVTSNASPTSNVMDLFSSPTAQQTTVVAPAAAAVTPVAPAPKKDDFFDDLLSGPAPTPKPAAQQQQGQTSLGLDLDSFMTASKTPTVDEIFG